MQFTIRFTTENTEACKWIFEQLKTGVSTNGITVTAISDGDLFKRLDIVEKQLDIMLEHSVYDLIDEDADEYDKLESLLETTWDRNIKE